MKASRQKPGSDARLRKPPGRGGSVGAGHAPPAAIRGRSFAGKVPGGRARPLQTAKMPEGASPSGIFNILLPLFLLPRLCQMPHRQNGMVEQHPRTAPAHDLADALPHLGLVAVRLADAAERFGRYMRAVVHPRAGSAPTARSCGTTPTRGWTTARI